MKKILALLLVAVLALGVFAGCGQDSDTDTGETTDTETSAANGENTEEANGEEGITLDSDFQDAVALKVNDTEIMLSTINVLVYQVKSFYESSYGPTVWDMDSGNGVTVGDQTKEDIEFLATRTEILKDIAADKGYEIAEEDKVEMLAQANTVFSAYTPEIVAQYGVTLEGVEDLILGQGLAEVVFQEMTADLELDEEDVESMKMSNTAYLSILQYGVEAYYEQVRARHILISTLDETGAMLGEEDYNAALATIEDLLQRALDGEDFAALATEYTQDPGSQETGGEYTFGRGQMVPEFEEAAYNLEVGGISDIVETDYGFHILKLEERIPATQEQISEAQQLLVDIDEEARYNVRITAFEEMYEEIEADYSIQRMDDIWDAISFNDPVDETEAAE